MVTSQTMMQPGKRSYWVWGKVQSFVGYPFGVCLHSRLRLKRSFTLPLCYSLLIHPLLKGSSASASLGPEHPKLGPHMFNEEIRSFGEQRDTVDQKAFWRSPVCQSSSIHFTRLGTLTFQCKREKDRQRERERETERDREIQRERQRKRAREHQ